MGLKLEAPIQPLTKNVMLTSQSLELSPANQTAEHPSQKPHGPFPDVQRAERSRLGESLTECGHPIIFHAGEGSRGGRPLYV